MIFSNLVLERTIFEVRYEHGFLYWDNCGKALAEFLGRFPKFEIRNVSVSTTQSDWWEEGMTIEFSHARANVTQDYPGNLNKFKDVCDSLCRVVQTHLNVKAFTRVGARFIYVFPIKTKEEAKEAVTRISVISIDPEKIHPFGKDVVERQLTLRVEDDDRGYTVRVANVTREFKGKLPKPFSVQTDRFHRHVVQFDVDSYTKKLVDSSIFMAADFIRTSERNIEENLMTLLGV